MNWTGCCTTTGYGAYTGWGCTGTATTGLVEVDIEVVGIMDLRLVRYRLVGEA